MPLMDHLRELRGRVIKSLIAMVPGTIIGWVFYDQIAHFLADPVCNLPVPRRAWDEHAAVRWSSTGCSARSTCRSRWPSSPAW